MKSVARKCRLIIKTVLAACCVLIAAGDGLQPALPPIDADETMYTIRFCKPEKTTAAMVKLYAKLTGTNFMQAKSLGRR